tara:strand:- start:78 stop:533 length:456 start_codon:yes stop_codon:yes gene_type:complete
MLIKIGELAKRSHCKTVTVRYYEKEGLLPEPLRSEGNYRLYGTAHVERMQFIRHCRSLDMALWEIRVLLRYRDEPNQYCDEVNALLDEHIQQVDVRIEELSRLKRQLVLLREKCAGARPAESCGILQGLSDCASHSNSSEDIPTEPGVTTS